MRRTAPAAGPLAESIAALTELPNDLLPPTHPLGPRRMRELDFAGPGGAEGNRFALGWPRVESDAGGRSTP